MNRAVCITMSILCASFLAQRDLTARPRPAPASTSTSAHATARLIVQRAPNFGSDLSVRLLIDGKKVASIPRNQHYGGILIAGRHTVTALALPNTEARRPTSIALNMKPGKVYIFTATWTGDRLELRPSDFYTPTARANR